MKSHQLAKEYWNIIRQRSMKHKHEQVFWKYSCNCHWRFSQVQLVCNSFVFKIDIKNLDSIEPNFWLEITCVINKLMCQSTEQFISILNHFQTTKITNSRRHHKQCTIHWAQSPTLDNCAFDLQVHKHGFRIDKKENLNLLQSTWMKIFQIDFKVAIEMH